MASDFSPSIEQIEQESKEALKNILKFEGDDKSLLEFIEHGIGQKLTDEDREELIEQLVRSAKVSDQETLGKIQEMESSKAQQQIDELTSLKREIGSTTSETDTTTFLQDSTKEGKPVELKDDALSLDDEKTQSMAMEAMRRGEINGDQYDQIVSDDLFQNANHEGTTNFTKQEIILDEGFPNAFDKGVEESDTATFLQDSAKEGDHYLLNVRAGKNPDSDIMTKLKNNSDITVLDNNDGDWVKVLVDGKKGYVKSDYVDVSNDGTRATVKTPTLPISKYKEVDWDNLLTRLRDKTLTGILPENNYYKMLEELKDNPNGPSKEKIEQAKISYEENKSLGTSIQSEMAPVFSSVSSVVSNGVGWLKDQIGNVTEEFKNLKLNSDENDNLLEKSNNLYGLNQTIKDTINAVISQLKSSLNNETVSYLGDLNELYGFSLKIGISSIFEKIGEIIGLVSRVKNGMEEINLKEGAVQPQIISQVPVNETRNRSRKGTEKPEEQPQIDEIETEPLTEETEPVKESEEIQNPVNEIVVENQNLIASSMGSIVFPTTITLFQTIGGEQVNSNLKTEYGLLGIEKVDEIFYCKLIDKKTGKIYYANRDDITFEMEGTGVLHTKEKTLILNSTDIGADDNFVKLAEPDSYYLITENQEINGINFATIIDSEDGNNYYVPVSDSIEVLSFEQITNQVSTEVGLDVEATK